MKQWTKIVNIGGEFSKFPGGRFLSDGPFSGERFRTKYAKVIKENDKVVFQLDYTAGYGSSFLEEAFGGLVRDEKLTAEELHRKIDFETDDDSLIGEIWEYIDNAGTPD